MTEVGKEYAKRAEPRCPDCGVEGVVHIVAVASQEKDARKPWFEIVLCNRCGHVYGVFPKHVYT